MELNKIYQGNSLEVLKTLSDNSIDCVVTSPPYWGLRDYGSKDQLGLEKTPEEFVNKLADIFDEVKRILKPKGTLWLNMGDSYASRAGGYDITGSRGSTAKISKNTQAAVLKQKNRKPLGLKPKDLIGVPWMIAFELRKRGWYLRQDIIWHKPNPMPESITDRCTKSHEYIFLLSKSEKYYYDHISIMKDVVIDPDKKDGNAKASWNGSTFDKGKTGYVMDTHGGRKSGNKRRKESSERGCPTDTASNVCASVPWQGKKANKRSVWTVATKPFAEAHFATFPEDLIVDCIEAGSNVNGIILDPFMGAGTTALVSRKLNRNFIGIELNPEYINIAEKRLKKQLGFFQ